MSINDVIEKRWKHYCKVAGINPDGQYAEESYPMYASAYRIGVEDTARSMRATLKAANAVVEAMEEGCSSLETKVKVLKAHLKGLK